MQQVAAELGAVLRGAAEEFVQGLLVALRGLAPAHPLLQRRLQGLWVVPGHPVQNSEHRLLQRIKAQANRKQRMSLGQLCLIFFLSLRRFSCLFLG